MIKSILLVKILSNNNNILVGKVAENSLLCSRAFLFIEHFRFATLS